MSLNLPKPVNTYAGEDELRAPASTVNGANGDAPAPEGAADLGDMGEYVAPRRSDKFKQGMIYPPKEIRGESATAFGRTHTPAKTPAIIDKTAVHIFKSPSPQMLEDKIREHQKNDPKFSFLGAEDPYYQYYKYMLEKSAEDAEDAAKGIVQQEVAAAKAEEVITTTAHEPKAHEFKVDLPGVTAHDL